MPASAPRKGRKRHRVAARLEAGAGSAQVELSLDTSHTRLTGKETTLPPTPITDPGHPLPRPEHPRPECQREPWINLNGRWRFTFDPQNAGEQKRWYRVPHPTVDPNVSASVADPFRGEIVVPFPWESSLS